MPDREAYVFQVYGSEVIIQEGLIVPVIDTHMHIQSNDIAPLPIMYGMLNYKLSKAIYEELPGMELKNEKKINFIDLNYLKRTDHSWERRRESEKNKKLIPIRKGGPFLCDFANDNIISSLDNAIKEIYASSENIKKAMIIVFGAFHIINNPIGSLTLLIIKEEIQKFFDQYIINPQDDKKRSLLTEITAQWLTPFIKDYGEITRQNSFFIAGMYKNDAIKDSQLKNNPRVILPVFNNDNANNDDITNRVKIIDEGTKFGNEKNPFLLVSEHYYQNSENNIIPSFSMSVIHSMDLMFAHYWGAYGIPIYIPYKEKLYYIADNLINPRKPQEKWYNIYDADNPYIHLIKFHDLPLANCNVIDNNLLGINVKYKHFLKEVPESEMRQLEDFNKHLKYTEAAVIRYPLEYLPFYHVDPRRFFAPKEGAIGKYNDFFIYDSKGTFERIDGNVIENKINKATDPFTYRMDIKEVKSQLIHKVNGVWQPGLFWGVKMYTALGYPPYLFDNNEAKKVFRCLKHDSYNELLEFYKFCADCEVPITCHGSPQGMTIADPGTFLKEYLKDHERDSGYGKIKSNFPVDGKGLMYGMGLVDSFSSPASWKLVLEGLGRDRKQKLKLCLAHYGGRDFYSGKYENTNNSPYCWMEKITGLIEEYESVYTDISNFGFKDFVPMPKEINENIYDKVKNKIPDNFIETVYTYNNKMYNYDSGETPDAKNLALLRLYIILEYQQENDNNIYKELFTTAKKLSELISKSRNPGRLRNRILLGTDWPMCEMDVKGIQRYNSAMFVLLQLVTVLQNNEWDAWHQFAVINPLRFLGLLKDPDENLDEYWLDMSKIDKMKEGIGRYLSGFKQKEEKEINSRNKEEIDDFQSVDKATCDFKINNQYVYLKEIAGKPLPSAARMIGTGNRLLLNNMVKGSEHYYKT